MSSLSQVFRPEEQGSKWSNEIIGGLTTFAAMAYIIVVNPAILSAAGIPVGPSTVATILTAVIGCVAMGFWTNRPIAVAPYMGENAFIAYGLAALGISWQQRLGAVFISGIILVIITVLGLRLWLAKALSSSMKNSFAAGIGLFLAFIGLYESGIVTSGAAGMPYQALLAPDGNLLRAPAVPVKIGDFSQPQVLLAMGGFIVMAYLICRQVKGALLLGMVITALGGWAAGHGRLPEGVTALPFAGQYDLGAIAGKLEIGSILKFSFFPVFLTLFLMVFLDTLGTLVGLGAAAKILDKNDDFPQIERPMMVDACTTTVGALLGTSTSGAFIESAAGIREGARTGVAALVTGLCFAVCLFFIPLVEPLQHLTYVYAPALVVVGILMMERISAIRFDDWTEAVPAIVTIGMMVFTYNIANGLTAGLALYPALKLACGRGRELHPGSVILGLFCLAYYIFGLIH